jgi:hypothetical protein
MHSWNTSAVRRPSVDDSEFVFLRSTAPYDPFALRPASKVVGHIARAALKRADVHPPTRGAHVFRHCLSFLTMSGDTVTASPLRPPSSALHGALPNLARHSQKGKIVPPISSAR